MQKAYDVSDFLVPKVEENQMAKIKMELANELTFEEGCEEYLQDCNLIIEMVVNGHIVGRL